MTSTEEVASRVREAVEACAWGVDRVVWLAGGSSPQRSEVLAQLAEHDGFSHVNVGVALSRRLLDCPARQRPVRARSLFRNLVNDAEADSTTGVVGLDHIEVLFSPDLQLDVFGLLRGEAQNRTLVISWCGHVEDGRATYAPASHPEHSSEPVDDHTVVRVDA
jgi:hypothetical protein